MAKTVTLEELIEDIRALYEVHEVRISPTVLARWVNKSLALLWDHVALSNPDHFTKSDTISVVSGTDTYNMATETADFYKGQGLDVLLDTGRYSPLRTFNWEEREMYANTTVTRADQLYRYMGNLLYLRPTPSWSGTVRVWYVPTATVLTSTNSVDLFNSWDEFIVWDVALKCAISEEAPADAIRQTRNQLLADIKSFAPQRDLSHNDRVRDVYAERRGIINPFARLPRPG